MKNLLVPVDFSRQSISAVRFALDIARKSRATLHLLHVFDLPVIHGSPLLPIAGFKQNLISELKQVAEKKFERIIKEFNTDNITVRTRAATGQIHPSLITFIKENAIDLLVMGTKGSNGFREWVIGSNTEKMVRTSPVPLFAIKEYIPADNIKNIVFPTTLDIDDQEELVTNIKILQNFFLATLHIIWVNTPSVFRPDEEIRKLVERFRAKIHAERLYHQCFQLYQ